MGAHAEVDDAKYVAGVGVAAVYSVAEDWHIGEASVRHYEQLMHRAGKTFEHDFRLIGNGIEEQHFRAHLVDRNHPACVFSARHGFFPWSWADNLSRSFGRNFMPGFQQMRPALPVGSAGAAAIATLGVGIGKNTSYCASGGRVPRSRFAWPI